jgi:hypothetical protein
MEKEIVYIIWSRDYGFIDCVKDGDKADEIKSNQEVSENYAGGRPSVWIQKATVN